MRLYEFCENDKDLLAILENASGGGTAAGAIASIASPVGGVIRRMPTTPNLFGYVAPTKAKKKSKRSKRTK